MGEGDVRGVGVAGRKGVCEDAFSSTLALSGTQTGSTLRPRLPRHCQRMQCSRQPHRHLEATPTPQLRHAHHATYMYIMYIMQQVKAPGALSVCTLT